MCNDIVPFEAKSNNESSLSDFLLFLLYGARWGREGMTLGDIHACPRSEGDEYTYIDVSQISDAVNGCIWLVVKAASLIPRVP